MSDDRVTTGEIYRVCQRIEAVVMLQNSRIRKLEEDAIRLKTIWTGTVVAITLGADWLKHKVGF